jgi:hypothetical protein
MYMFVLSSLSSPPPSARVWVNGAMTPLCCGDVGTWGTLPAGIAEDSRQKYGQSVAYKPTGE